MKRFWATVIVIVAAAASTPAYSADDPVGRAMKLYEKRHYAEAAFALKAEMGAIEPARQSAAQLTLGMLYLKNAELHRELYQTSVTATVDYLKKLATDQGKNKSRFADLHLGEALAAIGKPDTAIIHLERFIASEGTEPKYKALAGVALGLCHFLKDDKQKAEDLWKGLEAVDPEVKAELAAAYAKAGRKEQDPVAVIDNELNSKKAGAALSMRMVKNALSVYAASGHAEKGIELMKHADLKAVSYRESISKSKIISFYELSLLQDMSSLFLQASIAALEKAAADAKLKDTVNYYLGEAYALAGNIDQSFKTTTSFLSSPMPQQLKDKAMARQAANHYQKGKQFEAIGVWDELMQKQPADPEVLAEVLFSCGRLKIDCPKVAQKSSAAVEAGEGRRLFILNIALGRYYFAKKDYPKAAVYFEAGRDKSNKNKIESNDPVMLVELAETYYRTKKFSEALEIYFEMSKQFPEVRQIQEAMGGIYSMEHKSAGDVKIF